MPRRPIRLFDIGGMTTEQRVAAAQRSRRRPSRVIRWRDRDPIAFNVADVVPFSGESSGICIFPMSHDYRIDAMSVRRMEILADATGHRVVGVETPGITMLETDPAATPTARVPLRIVLETARGDFSGLAALQVEAISDLTGVVAAEARILGESLGAQLGASIAVAAGGAKSLDLVEPANLTRMGIMNLWRLQRGLNGVEAERKAKYLARNRRVGWGNTTAFELSSASNAETDKHLKAFHRQGRYALATALGLLRPLSATIDALPQDTDVALWRADASVVCSADAVSRFAEARRAPAVETTSGVILAPTEYPEGLGHHCLTDLDLMLGFSTLLSREWRARS